MSQLGQSPIFSTMGDDPGMRELVEEFVDGLQGRIRSLEVAVATDDVEGLVRLAHQLKGASGGYGFDEISETAAKLEQSAKQAESVMDAAREVEALISVCRRATTTAAP